MSNCSHFEIYIFCHFLKFISRFYKHARLNKYKLSRGVLVLELYIPAIKPEHPDDEIDDKLFMHNSLLCLTCDNFETVLICMVHDAYMMKHGKVNKFFNLHFSYYDSIPNIFYQRSASYLCILYFRGINPCYA